MTKLQLVNTSSTEPMWTLYILGPYGSVINHIPLTSTQAFDLEKHLNNGKYTT